MEALLLALAKSIYCYRINRTRSNFILLFCLVSPPNFSIKCHCFPRFERKLQYNKRGLSNMYTYTPSVWMKVTSKINGRTRRKERMDNLVSKLKRLSLTWESRDLRDSLIPDRIVGWVLSDELWGELTLQTAHVPVHSRQPNSRSTSLSHRHLLIRNVY